MQPLYRLGLAHAPEASPKKARLIAGRSSCSLRKLHLRHIYLFSGVTDNDRLRPDLMPAPILNRPQEVNHLFTFVSWQPQQIPHQIGDRDLLE